jgi:hypothetical protein
MVNARLTNLEAGKFGPWPPVLAGESHGQAGDESPIVMAAKNAIVCSKLAVAGDWR